MCGGNRREAAWELKTPGARPPEFEVHATPEELQDFAASGYLIRKRLFQGGALTQLQEATDTLEAAE